MKQLLKTLFRIMLLQFVYSKEFNVENLFKALDVDDFKKYYARSEREDLIKLFKQVRNNLDETLKKLSS